MAKKVEVDFKLLVVAVAFLILATVGSAFATYLMFRNSNHPQTGTEQGTVTIARDLGPTYQAGQFTLNLMSTSNQQRFIRTEIVLEASDKKVIAELEKRQPQIRDHLITLIRSRSAEQLASENGMEILRYDIMKGINALVPKGEITDVFFIDLIVQ